MRGVWVCVSIVFLFVFVCVCVFVRAVMVCVCVMCVYSVLLLPKFTPVSLASWRV